MRTRDIIIGLLVLLALLGSISVMSGSPVAGRSIDAVVVTTDNTTLLPRIDDHFQRVEHAAPT